MKTTTFKRTSLVAYPLHAIFLNVFTVRKQRLVGNRYTAVGFPPVYCNLKEKDEDGNGNNDKMSMCGFILSIKVPLESGIRTIVASVGSERKMRVGHKTMKAVVGPPQKRELKRSEVKTGNLFE